MTNEERIIKAAISWWKSRRPVSWTHKMHIENPSVNTTGPRERCIAEAVAKYLRAKKMTIPHIVIFGSAIFLDRAVECPGCHTMHFWFKNTTGKTLCIGCTEKEEERLQCKKMPMLPQSES
jgi:ribosomal protein S27E